MTMTIDWCFSLLLEKQTKATRRIFKILQLPLSMEFRRQLIFRCQNTYRTSKSPRLGRSRWEEMKIRSSVSGEWNHKKQIFKKAPPNTTDSQCESCISCLQQRMCCASMRTAGRRKHDGFRLVQMCRGEMETHVERQYLQKAVSFCGNEEGSPLCKAWKMICSFSTCRNILGTAGSKKSTFQRSVIKKVLKSESKRGKDLQHFPTDVEYSS